jgi:hypothetical protein
VEQIVEVLVTLESLQGSVEVAVVAVVEVEIRMVIRSMNSWRPFCLD